MSDARPTVTIPYKPEDHVDTFGWLWTRQHQGEAARWHLVSTHVDTMDEDMFAICFQSTDAHEGATFLADTWAGLPYMPCTPPNCTPADTAMLTATLTGGTILTLTSRDPASDREFADLMRVAFNARLKDRP